MISRPLYQELAALVQARQNCQEKDNQEWYGKHTEEIERLARNFLPSGSGFDCGSSVDLEASKPDRLVIFTSFHHMNDGGYYDGWTEHQIIIQPSLQFGFTLRITGRNRNYIKEYMYDVFSHALEQTVER